MFAQLFIGHEPQPLPCSRNDRNSTDVCLMQNQHAVNVRCTFRIRHDEGSRVCSGWAGKMATGPADRCSSSVHWRGRAAGRGFVGNQVQADFLSHFIRDETFRPKANLVIANSSGPTKKYFQSLHHNTRLVQVFYRGQEEDDEALMAPSLLHLAVCATAILG